MSRKRKKSKKKRGSRTHGYGAARKHRGGGSRGGRGKAGRGKKAKHKKLAALKEKKAKGEDKGFSRERTPVTAMNLMDIDQQIEELVDKGYAEKEGDHYLFDAKQAGIDKILGKGQLKHEINIKANEFSSKAEKKLAEAGCKAITEDSESA